MAVTLLFAFGVLMGFATAPTLSYYATTNPEVLWQAGGATAPFIARLRGECHPTALGDCVAA